MKLPRAGPAVALFLVTGTIFLISPVRVPTDSRYSPLVVFLSVVFYGTAREVLPPRWSWIVAFGGALGTQIWTNASRALWGDTFLTLLLGVVDQGDWHKCCRLWPGSFPTVPAPCFGRDAVPEMWGMVDSDKHWIRFGEFDPYLKTVQTLDPYKLDESLPASTDFYFTSGERYLVDLFQEIHRYVSPDFKPRTAVDFGCSVGRIAVPLASRCASMIGVDISPGALFEAATNAAQFRVANARWVLSDGDLSRVSEPIDLFHSYNVLQHLPVSRGLKIFRRALALLSPGGVIAVHVPYADAGSIGRRAINWAQAHVPGVGRLANVARGRAFDYPQMLMNRYDIGAMVGILNERGCERAHCRFIDQRRYAGVILMARVPT